MDFFSGIGGFRKGFELCGMRCVGHCEIDKHADRSYRAIFDVKDDEWYRRDITEIQPSELPRANLWAGGFPCQDISIAGSRNGLNGARSGLFFELVRLLTGTAPEDRPEWIVLENVRNLLSVNSGFDLAAILHSLAALGYCVEYGLLNSKWFGVPQHRERVYIVAYRHLGAGGGRKVFPIPAGRGKALIQLIGGRQGRRVYDPSGVSCTLAAQGGGMGAKTGMYAVGDACTCGGAAFVDLTAGDPQLTQDARCIKARYTSGISKRGADNSGVFMGCSAVLTPEREKRQNGRRVKECGEPAFTVTAQDRHGIMLRECPCVFPIKEATKKGYAEARCGDSICLAFPESKSRRGRVGKGVAQTLDTGCKQGTAWRGRIRRLTPRECWRLQGFSDEMFNAARAMNSDSQLYHQAGNSVTIPVVYAVGQRIIEIEEEAHECFSSGAEQAPV